jgi:hypothetical protein
MLHRTSLTQPMVFSSQNFLLSASFEAFAAVKFQVEEVFWFVTPRSAVVGHQLFRRPCCLHIHPEDGGSMDF